MTPESDFEDEKRSAMTLECHNGAPVKHFPDLTKRFISKKYEISFFYPERWFVFDSPFYAPFPDYEGIISKKTGSVLSLASARILQSLLNGHPWTRRVKKSSWALSRRPWSD